MSFISIRGATTVSSNNQDEILKNTKELIRKIEQENDIDRQSVISILFTCTNDLDDVYPAKAARQIGYTSAGLMCFQEMNVKNSLKKCIRLILFYKTDLLQKDAKHIYLRDAKSLRPDLGGE